MAKEPVSLGMYYDAEGNMGIQPKVYLVGAFAKFIRKEGRSISSEVFSTKRERLPYRLEPSFYDDRLLVREACFSAKGKLGKQTFVANKTRALIYNAMQLLYHYRLIIPESLQGASNAEKIKYIVANVAEVDVLDDSKPDQVSYRVMITEKTKGDMEWRYFNREIKVL